MTKRVHFEFQDVQFYIKIPEWLYKVWTWKNYPCYALNCLRGINQHCKSCESLPIANLNDKYAPFVNMILSLVRKGLPRILATWITKTFIILPITVTFTCPYIKFKSGVYHRHCIRSIGNDDKPYELYEMGNGEMTLTK